VLFRSARGAAAALGAAAAPPLAGGPTPVKRGGKAPTDDIV